MNKEVLKHTKIEATIVLFCPDTLFSVIFKHTNFTLWPFSSDFSSGPTFWRKTCQIMKNISEEKLGQIWRMLIDNKNSRLFFINFIVGLLKDSAG